MEPVGVFAEGLALALALVLDGELEELALEDELSAAELEDAELELSELDEELNEEEVSAKDEVVFFSSVEEEGVGVGVGVGSGVFVVLG